MKKTEKTHTSFRDILHVIFKYKLHVAAIFFCIVSIVAVISLMMPKVYQAGAKVMVRFGRENVYMPTTPTLRENQPLIFDYSREELVNSEIEILSGRNLIERVIMELGVHNIYPELDKKRNIKELLFHKTDPAKREKEAFAAATLVFKKDFSVAAVRKSNIIDLSYQHNDPAIAALVLNKVIEVFFDLHLNVYKNPQGYKFFDSQVALLKKRLQDSEIEYKSFCRENDITALDQQKSLLLQTISSLKKEHAGTLMELSENEERMIALSDGNLSGSDNNAMGEETELNPMAISSIRGMLNELRMKEQELLSKYTPESLPVANIRNEIKKAQDLLNREERMYHSKAITSISHKLRALQKRESVQREQLNKFQAELDRINGLELQLRDLERKVTLNEENYQIYIKKVEQDRLSQDMDTQKIANVSVVEPALPPLKPIKPKLMLNIALSLVLGIFAGILIPMYMEYLQHSFSNREDVLKHLDLPVLASIPERDDS